MFEKLFDSVCCAIIGIFILALLAIALATSFICWLLGYDQFQPPWLQKATKDQQIRIFARDEFLGQSPSTLTE